MLWKINDNKGIENGKGAIFLWGGKESSDFWGEFELRSYRGKGESSIHTCESGIWSSKEKR